MGTFTNVSGTSPVDGAIAQPVASGRYGMLDPIRQKEALTVGMAFSFEDTTDATKRLNVYKYGNALAKSTLGGVFAQDGNAPSLSVAAATGDADCGQGIFAGYAPILLAPGEIVKRGDHLEPILAGASQAMWRVAPSGPATSREYYDNSAGTEGALVSSDLFPCCGEWVSSVGPSAAVTGTTAETAYNKTVTVPAYSLRVGDILRITGGVLCNNGAAGGNVIKVYINGIGSAALVTTGAVTFSANDVMQFQVDVRVNTTTLLALSGGFAFGTPGTVTYKAVPATAAVVLTAANVVTVAVTPNNIADSSTLEFLSVEKL